LRVIITKPGTAVIGDPASPAAEVIQFGSVRELNQRIAAGGYNATELAGAARCPACPRAGLFATIALVYRRGTQPAVCAAVLCDDHAQVEAARIASYGWPHMLLAVPLPARHRVYDLTCPAGYAALNADLTAWPDLLAILTAGVRAPVSHVTAPVPEPAGAVS
jgi:hypothetical protein